MKVVRDLSVTSANPGAGAPWDLPWMSPTTMTAPAMVLDFDAGIYGSDGQRQAMASVMNFDRASAATRFDDTGSLVTSPADTARIEHDPVTLAPLGLLLEAGRTNLLVNTAAPADQTVTVTADTYVLSFYGTGSVALSGAYAGTFAGSGTFPTRTTVQFSAAAGALDVVFTGQVLFPQVEKAEEASSYIECGASATARADDIATVPLGPWFSSSAGTIVFGGALLDAAANDRLIELDAGDTSTRLSVLWNTTLGLPQLQVWDAGVLQAAIAPTGNSLSFGETFRVVVSFAGNDFAISLNGSAPVKDTLGSLPTGLTNLRIGRSIWGAQGLLQAESLVYYPERLSDAEIQALSA